MPTPTYDLIASTTLNSSTETISFSSIPSTYRDLVLVMETVTTDGGTNTSVILNDNLSFSSVSVFMFGSGTATNSGTTNHLAHWVSTRRVLTIMNIFDYSATDKHKTVLTRSNDAGARVYAYAGRWPNTSAVTKVTVGYVGQGFTYSSGSTFHLYGIVS